MDAAASRDKLHSLAARASSQNGPRSTILANMQVHKGGTSANHYLNKTHGTRGGASHAHELHRKYNKQMTNGIVAHRAIYGGTDY